MLGKQVGAGLRHPHRRQGKKPGREERGGKRIRLVGAGAAGMKGGGACVALARGEGARESGTRATQACPPLRENEVSSSLA